MEDGDGEDRIMDTWTTLGDRRYKDSTIDDLMRDANTTSSYNDGIEENNEERFNSAINEAPTNKSAGPTAKIVFKGFKKRILAQAQENQTVTSRNITQEQQLLRSNVPTKSTKDKRSETKRGKITEYAQYLGLQPASKYKCLKCHSSTSFCSMSMLKQHQRTCSNAMAPVQGVLASSESSSLPLASNFKITRKVYLCSACGTYFENWNLFLHMREVHKRHICLFCLGMFGQAERLSYHLSSKHSVPEMAFSSVEDFYNSFKGSCYLICCSCEKVFSEMDNFYNHFCSMSQKQQSATKVCSPCKQMGSHSANCSPASERNKAINTSVQMSGGPQQDASVACVSAQPMIGNGKGIPRRIVRNNRPRHGEESVASFYRQKSSDAHSKKINVRSQSTAKQGYADVVSNTTKRKEAEMPMGSVRDTVAETIMEVSRYTGDSDGNEIEGEGREIDGTWHEEISKDISPVRSVQGEPYDSVTQTIMEVSRGTTVMESDIVEENESSFVMALENEVIKVPEDISVEENMSIREENISVHESVSIPENTNVPENMHSSIEEPTANKELDERLNPSSPMEQESDEERTRNEEVQTPNETRTDSGSRVFDSTVSSPAVRSLFSPQHESQMSDVHPKERCLDRSTEEQRSVVPGESQTSVSFNTVTTSDRSLVIKICTNKNSKFSVTTASANVNNSENHDTSRESEENNNGEGSTSEEKASNLSEREQESISSYQANDGDSDSDSDKLAVADSNVEEGETEAEFGTKAVSEGEVASEVEAASEAEAEAASEAEMNVEAECEKRKEEETEEPNQGELDNQGKENNLTMDVAKGVVEENQSETDDTILANEDVPSIDLNVEGILDTVETEELLKRCINAASATCVYCNHARQIAVDGKQLGLHMLAEHRFQPQHPAIIIHREQFIARVKKSLCELESRYLNLDSYDSTSGTYNISNVRTYECFHCRFHSAVHKELYLHNRKMHQKTILICIMCKSTFYSYSELLCHLCSGVYSPNVNVRYRCCLCPASSLPSAFRLMVHLRKRHHACDVCLESTGNQQRLSNHVWKHKLHHLCYRCGIAYRNKPDITKHLFWKHGTESVLCKKCLQKKWPHIYHFCIPPTAFVCEECGSSFSHAVALRVHKRLHSGDLPYSCGECNERFISKKLLSRHENGHKELRPVEADTLDTVNDQPYVDEKLDKDKATSGNTAVDSVEFAKEPKESVKKVVDVYDLPPLNLSSESDSDTADEKDEPTKRAEKTEKDKTEPMTVDGAVLSAKTDTAAEPNDSIVEVVQNEEEKKQEAQIMDGIWDNFKSYTASLEIQDSMNKLPKDSEGDIELLRDAVLFDHDYCLPTSAKSGAAPAGEGGPVNANDNVALGAEHDYTGKPPKSPSVDSTVQNVTLDSDTNKKKIKTSKKKKQNGNTSSSDSSTDSDSSSCSCGPNCSCSSSSSGSSSSSTSTSDSDSSASESSPHKQSSRKERRKERDSLRKNKSDSPEPESKEGASQIENGTVSAQACNSSVCPATMLLRESDLETDETETDEDFYDEHPQQLANKLLAEKRNRLMLLAAVAPASTEPTVAAPLNNGAIDVDTLNHSPDPIVASADDVPQVKKKVKTKKRKKSDRGKQRCGTPTVESIKLNIPKSFYQNKLGLTSSSPAVITVVPSRASTPNFTTLPDEIGIVNSGTESQTIKSTSQNVGSGSENENKRSSKRKRVPKRFYGDSSDEEGEKQPPLKWRKVEAPTFVSTLKPLPPQLPFVKETVTYRPSAEQLGTLNVTASASESEGLADSSSDSSDTEPELNQPAAHLPEASAPAPAPAPERSDNLYCYCQCPYDEVSEMIACDGEDCHIEWFHFECVGIMVPPKGKWYCPDCRKKYGILQNNEDYFD